MEKITIGDLVKVVKGNKIPIGITGKVTLLKFNPWSLNKDDPLKNNNFITIWNDEDKKSYQTYLFNVEKI